jgi:DNA-directed RNA polymerase
MEEYDRQEMLKSDDQEVREKAEKMVTPASVFIASDSSDLALPSELSEAALGVVPVEDGSPDPDLFESAIGQDSLTKADEGDSNVEPRTKTREQQIHVWVPLTFPDVPKRGDWDVSRLKDSVYFFS